MKFDEQGFRHLVDETIATIIRLGTTSHAVLDRYERFTEMLHPMLTGKHCTGSSICWQNSRPER